MPFLTDNAAREVALTRWALPECLHVPIAAVDEAAITTYIGDIEQVLAEGSPRRALLVRAKEQRPIDRQFPIWELPASRILHEPRQVWVHIEFTRYRRAYRKAFPDEAIDGKVLSHALNRRMAALMGFSYVRITPNSRGCNSSSSFSEQWGVALHAAPEQVAETWSVHSLRRLGRADGDAGHQAWRWRHGRSERGAKTCASAHPFVKY